MKTYKMQLVNYEKKNRYISDGELILKITNYCYYQTVLLNIGNQCRIYVRNLNIDFHFLITWKGGTKRPFLIKAISKPVQRSIK